MDYKAMAAAIKLCGSTPKFDQCKKECPYWDDGHMNKCIPRMTEDAATAITDLLARAEESEADNKKLCAAMMQLKRTDRPERMSVIYELEYDSSMSHKTMEEVAGIFFRGLMDADLKLRGQKEE